MIREALYGALFILAIVKTKLALVGMLLIVRNCCPNELELVHGRDVPELLHTGLAAKRLLNVLCNDELITILELTGTAVLVKVRVAVDVAPTNGEDAVRVQAIVFGFIAIIPELAKATPEDAACI